jgi:hypothetical protein
MKTHDTDTDEGATTTELRATIKVSARLSTNRKFVVSCFLS